MDKLNIYICENFVPEFHKVIEKEGFDDIIIKPYPCMCENKSKKEATKRLLQDSASNGEDGFILCSKNCDIIPIASINPSFEILSTN